MDLKKRLQDELSQHHSYQPEFHAAVEEVLNDVIEYGQENNEELFQFLERLIEPDRTLRFKIEWVDDGGVTRVNRAWRVQFNNSLGVYKGGLRFHPTCNESVLKFLGFEQIFKNALTGLSMGGAKGGSDFDPKGKSMREVQRFCESLMTELCKYIGADMDVPAGDIGVGTREIAFLFGQYLKIKGSYSGVITGKDPSFGGSCGRVEATGYGVIYLLNEALLAHDIKIKGKRVLISGAGNVALHAAEKALELGTLVLSLSDSKGSLHFPEGLTQNELEELKSLKIEERKRLSDWSASGSKAVYKDGCKPWELELNCDIILPCATQNEVSLQDLERLLDSGVQVVAEGANMPLTKDALELVIQKNLIFLPGKAANAGGVAVSGLERTQNSSNVSWDLETVDTKLKDIMKRIHENCASQLPRRDGVIPYKSSANIYAFVKLKSTMLKLWP